MNRHRALLLFAYVAVAWGGSYPAIKIGLPVLDPLFFAATRLCVAAVVTLPAAALLSEGRAWLPTTRGDYAYLAVGSVFLTGLANAFLFAGQQYATSGVGAVLFSLNPVLAAGLATVLLPSEALALLDVVGVLLGLVGVYVVASPSLAALLSGGGKLLFFFAAACIALGSVLTQRLDTDLPPLAGTGWSLVGGSVLLVGLTALLGRPFAVDRLLATPSLVGAALYLGVVATAGAYGAYFSLLPAIGPVRTNLVSYLVPVVATLLGVVLLGESVTLSTWVGFAAIAAGFFLLNRAELRPG